MNCISNNQQHKSKLFWNRSVKLAYVALVYSKTMSQVEREIERELTRKKTTTTIRTQRFSRSVRKKHPFHFESSWWEEIPRNVLYQCKKDDKFVTLWLTCGFYLYVFF